MQAPQLLSKPRYSILDGLRGVAAVMVVIFHVFEAHARGHFDQIVNHGYLAVDFFFVLSGFVVAYAYDDRFVSMGVMGFFKRRLVRLHPMVIMGSVVGAALFYFGDSVVWPDIHKVPAWKMLGMTLIGFTMVPVPVSMDIRGWRELYPINGPAWTLMLEYIANLLYGLVIRHLPKWALGALVSAAGCALVNLAVFGPHGDVVGGWSMTGEQLNIGFTRLVYPFFAGLLLFRMVKLIKIKHAFWLCSLLIVTVFCVPRIGGAHHPWMNGLYESFCIIFIFPLIVFLGASGTHEGKYASRACKFLGDISYPIYITHYPIIYWYTGWVADKKLSFGQAYPVGLLVVVSSIILAYLCFGFYDVPVRRWLGKKVLLKNE
ncbi:MAG TPA: acyltransferase [Chitinivibrionales bacterium]|nr:acyltransferase [Chitinivibrionales bacterium]